MSMQSALKDLRNLRQEEMSMINLAAKISDQLNRLKVEELALQNMVRIQNEEQERATWGTNRSRLSSNPTGETLDNMSDSSGDEMELDLNVNRQKRGDLNEEEEEEEEDSDVEVKIELHNDDYSPEDIEEFVKQLQ